MAAKPAIAYEREQTLRYTRELALYELALVQTLRNQRPFTDRVLQAFGLLGQPRVNRDWLFLDLLNVHYAVGQQLQWLDPNHGLFGNAANDKRGALLRARRHVFEWIQSVRDLPAGAMGLPWITKNLPATAAGTPIGWSMLAGSKAHNMGRVAHAVALKGTAYRTALCGATPSRNTDGWYPGLSSRRCKNCERQLRAAFKKALAASSSAQDESRGGPT